MRLFLLCVLALGCSADHYASQGKEALDAHALADAEKLYRKALKAIRGRLHTEEAYARPTPTTRTAGTRPKSGPKPAPKPSSSSETTTPSLPTPREVTQTF